MIMGAAPYKISLNFTSGCLSSTKQPQSLKRTCVAGRHGKSLEVAPKVAHRKKQVSCRAAADFSAPPVVTPPSWTVLLPILWVAASRDTEATSNLWEQIATMDHSGYAHGNYDQHYKETMGHHTHQGTWCHQGMLNYQNHQDHQRTTASWIPVQDWPSSYHPFYHQTSSTYSQHQSQFHAGNQYQAAHPPSYQPTHQPTELEKA